MPEEERAKNKSGAESKPSTVPYVGDSTSQSTLVTKLVQSRSKESELGSVDEKHCDNVMCIQARPVRGVGLPPHHLREWGKFAVKLR